MDGMVKKCTKCSEIKPLDQFAKRADRPCGVLAQCKKCKADRRSAWGKNIVAHLVQQGAEYYKNNKNYEIEGMRKWRAANRQKSRNLAKARKTFYRVCGLSVSSAYKTLEDACNQYKIGDKYLDVYTGELIDNPSVDHIIPISKGGRHELDNLCTTSMRNNLSKHNKSLVMFLWARAVCQR